MQFRWDKKYLYTGMTAFCVIAGSILVYLLFSRLPQIGAGLSAVMDILKPILYGIVIAYLLWPLVRLFEKHFMRRFGHFVFKQNDLRAEHFARAMSISLAMVLLFGVVAGLLVLILPQLGESIKQLISSMPQYVEAGINWIKSLFSENSDAEQQVIAGFNSVTQYLTNWAQSDLLPMAESLFSNVTASAVDFLYTIFQFLIGVVAAAYLLYSKETFLAQSKKMVYTLFKPQRANRLLHNMRYANDLFSRTVIGRLLEACLVGLICFVLMLIFRIPYAGLISVLVGVTDIIPFFGPFIGAIPSAFLILLVDPVKALIFVALIVVLQQFEGNVLAPKILGNLTGMPSFWVMFSTVVMGGLFGVGGMVLGVPIFALLLTAIRSFSAKRLQKKGLPTATAQYIDLVEIAPDGTPVCAENGEVKDAD